MTEGCYKPMFKDWKIEKPIGEGAFGKVYKITREEFGHTYEAALKRIEIPQSQAEVESARNDGMTDEEIAAYFRDMVGDIVDEFALMSKLKGNSNIVSYEDHAVIKKKDGFGWSILIRMELLTPLYQHIKTHSMTYRDVIQLGIDICSALEVCQKYNIIHRDIKPENIFITELGTYKLGDFGIARQLEKTSTGLSKKGTIPYMAPEVYKGTEYNSTVDVYSLGLVLYRFLNNNRSPFLPPAPQPIKYSDKQKADIMRMSGQALPKPCNADGRLAEVILKACEYNPKHRYESAVAMKKALSSLLYTEGEKDLIYPDGDILENKSIRYLSEKSAEIGSLIKEPGGGEEKTGTVYLFREEKSAVEEPPASQVPFRSEKTVQENKEPAKPELSVEPEKLMKWSVISLLSHRRSMAWILVAVLIIGGGFWIWYVSYHKGKDAVRQMPKTVAEVTEVPKTTASPVDKVKVPSLLGLPKSEAGMKVSGMKLKVEQSEDYSDSVKKGCVMSQSPVADTKVEMGSVVHVVVSKGVQLFRVPKLIGKTKKKATVLLKKQNLKWKIVKAYNNTYGKDRVVRQSIKENTKVKKGTVVAVTLSLGKRPVPVVRTPSPVVTPVPRPDPTRRPVATKKPVRKKKPSGGEESYKDWDLVN